MANTTYQELYQRVLLRLGNLASDGRALLAAKEAVNTAHKAIARVQDFDELLVLDTTNAATVASTKTYHLEDDWGLTRPKDLLTVRYMDGNNSRKLTRLTARELDEKIPYVEGLGEQKPRWYIRRGNSVELIPVPDEAKDVYVYYSQWPKVLTEDSDTTSYSDLDDVIIALGTEIALAVLEGTHADWDARARAYLASAVKDNRSRPDRTWVARPFEVAPGVTGEPWKDPFVKSYP